MKVINAFTLPMDQAKICTNHYNLNISLSICANAFLSFFSEFFVENMGDFFIFLRRFADDILENSAESLEHILNFITVFMGSVERCVVLSSPSPLMC